MKTKLTKGKTLNLIGWDKNKQKVVKITRVICFRKPASLIATRRIMSKRKYAIGIVSCHNIYRKPNTPFCKVWLSCFKDPEKYFKNKPTILLSESDFVDPYSLSTTTGPTKWDFCYFTMGGRLGSDYKGMHVFVDSLPILCGKMKLKGIVIKYAKENVAFHLNSRRWKILKRYSSYIKIVKGSKNAARIMATSRFSFFPNTVDCSPLMLSESLVRNSPILVNEDILGGWKYVNDETGALFSIKNLEEKANFVLDGDFNTQDSYMMEYGYKNTATRLADFCAGHMPLFDKYSMVGFAGTEKTMQENNCV